MKLQSTLVIYHVSSQWRIMSLNWDLKIHYIQHSASESSLWRVCQRFDNWIKMCSILNYDFFFYTSKSSSAENGCKKAVPMS